MKTYEVTVNGFPPVVYSAQSPSKARVGAWRSFTCSYDCTFKDFLRISTVKRCGVPADDGYASVRRQYGVDPKVGGRVCLINEGQNSGLEGEVAYPGKSTAYVHVLIDGDDHISVVHPLNVEFITEGTGT